MSNVLFSYYNDTHVELLFCHFPTPIPSWNQHLGWVNAILKTTENISRPTLHPIAPFYLILKQIRFHFRHSFLSQINNMPQKG